MHKLLRIGCFWRGPYLLDHHEQGVESIGEGGEGGVDGVVAVGGEG